MDPAAASPVAVTMMTLRQTLRFINYFFFECQAVMYF
jgi:hypothetical protein